VPKSTLSPQSGTKNLASANDCSFLGGGKGVVGRGGCTGKVSTAALCNVSLSTKSEA
jgi:hypothetical protein